VVVPNALGGLTHYYRDNDLPGTPWASTSSFGGSTIYDSVSLIQSNFDVVGDEGGNLEVIARSAGALHHFYRDGTTGAWIGPELVASGVQGSPSFIQSVHGNPGNFELVTPLASGGMAHLYRDNSDANFPWIGPTPVPGVSGSVSAVSIIQSNYGVGSMQWVARVNDELLSGSRDDGDDWEWHGPHVFSAQPCCDPATKGQWADAVAGGIVAIHGAVLRNRKVLFFGFADDDGELGVSRVFDPATNQISVPSFTTDMHPNLFCGGQSALPDGRIFVSGGDHEQLNDVHVYSPTTNQWSHAGVMNDSRWYPTTATLANGRVFMISGSGGTGGSVHDWFTSTESPSRVNNTWQVYNGASLSRAVAVTPNFSPDFFAVDLYPFVYLLPNGKLLVHSRSTTRFLTLGGTFPNLTGSWDATALHTVWPHPRTYPRQGCSVLLPLEPDSTPAYRAKVLISGGSGERWPAPSTPATATVEALDLGTASPSWQSVAPMNFARLMHDTVLLPDGKVLAVGGSAIGRADDGSAPVLTPEVYSPSENTWTKLCPMRVPRGYHSIALLLPDARVLVAGKDGLFNAPPYQYPEQRVEIFSPPYLFAGTRPTITSAPTVIGYTQSFTVGVGTVPTSAIGRVALLRLGATTHGVNMDQRNVGVRIATRGATTLTLTAPPNGNVAPPGYYMLFLLTTNGVPSVSAIVRLQ
jgi:Domain of unknown function (DUF1929)/Glyoxal oxidase N-terminus/Kelch motif